MQLLLTEEEYQGLLAMGRARAKSLDANLQAFCTRVANELPIQGWHTHDGPPKPWGCLLTAAQDWYCDDCPARDICPHPDKEWSK